MGIKAPYSPSPYPPSGPYDCMKPQCRSSSLGMALGTEKLQHRKLSALMEFRGLRFRLYGFRVPLQGTQRLQNPKIKEYTLNLTTVP